MIDLQATRTQKRTPSKTGRTEQAGMRVEVTRDQNLTPLKSRYLGYRLKLVKPRSIYFIYSPTWVFSPNNIESIKRFRSLVQNNLTGAIHDGV